MRANGFVLLLLLLSASTACNQSQGSNVSPRVLPAIARLGDTVQVGLSADIALMPDEFRSFDLDTNNVTVELVQVGNGATATVNAKAVFDTTPGRATHIGRDEPGITITTVVFDVPTDLASHGFTFPSTVTVEPLRLGQSIHAPPGGTYGAFVDLATLEILGSGGAPTAYWPTGIEDDLGPRPALRLRATGNFPSGVNQDRVGSLQFDLVVPPGLGTPHVVPQREASAAAVATSQVGTDRYRIVVVHPGPDGFQVAPTLWGSAPDLGEGPLLDITFDTGGFIAADFGIEDLYVGSPSGAELVNEVGDSSAYFVRIARANQ